MRILLINDYGTLAGGAEVIVFRLRDELRARGHDVRVFTSSAGAAGAEILADHTGFGTTGRWRTLLQCANLSAARSLGRVIADFRPDVVHVNLYLTQLSPLILRKLAGVPSVYYAQWYRAICPLGTRCLPGGAVCGETAGLACLRRGCVPARDGMALAVQRMFDREAGRRFTKVAAISAAVANRLREFGAAHLHGATVVHPGTPVVVPRREPTAEPTAVSACRLVPEKGVDVLLHAFARVARRHPTSRLQVIGDGPERAALGRLAAGLGIAERVDFRGALPHGLVLGALRSAWVACVPSLWEEPFGLFAAEAQMEGVAVVASAGGGLAEIVADGDTGHLVPAGDAHALAGRLESMFDDRAATMACGARAHERACEHFSLGGFAARFEEVYRAAIAAR